MLKVRVACPVCGTPILAGSLDGHMNRHKLRGAGVLTLRLHPTSPYEATEGTVLKILCMYCGAGMGEKPGYGVSGETSGICRPCWATHFPGISYPREEDGVD